MSYIPEPIVHPIDTEKVSDGLQDEFRSWRNQSPVLISAQTGAGKNYFITEHLIPYAIETKQPVYLFTNRVALNVQQKKGLLRTMAYPNIFSDDELEHITSFGLISIVNYQSAMEFLHPFGYSSPIGTSPCVAPLSHGYVIFDEAHFFLSDSLFNASTYQILQRLIFAFSGYVRIYMTATPDNVLPIISELEMANEASKYINLSSYNHQNPKTTQQERALHIYEFPRSYSNYNITFFTDISQLYDQLGKATAKNKWLCFINDTHQQRLVAEDLKQTQGVTVTCFDRTKKTDEKTWKSLMQGQLPANILFTTIALDNGVNLTDPNLHNIVIDCADKVSLLQMAGRKRRAPDERVNLYIRSPQPELIKHRLLSVRDQINFLDEYNQNPAGFLQSHWQNFHQEYRNLFFIDNEHRLVPNFLAKPELIILHEFYAKLLFEMQEASNPLSASEIYPRMVLEWMGLPQDIHWINSTQIDHAISELSTLLESHMTTGVPTEEHKVFFNKFANFADIILNGSGTLRKDPRSGPSIMSEFLETYQKQLGNCYSIEGRGTWKVCRKSSTRTFSI